MRCRIGWLLLLWLTHCTTKPAVQHGAVLRTCILLCWELGLLCVRGSSFCCILLLPQVVAVTAHCLTLSSLFAYGFHVMQ
jgi:hypothetical protein